MKRTLSLSLDDQNFRVLHLTPEMDAAELDKYTITNFEDSEQIRTCYQEEIAEFLSAYKSYIQKVEEVSGKKFRGWITLLETREDKPGEVSFERARVLYAKHVVALPTIISHQAVLKEFQRQYNIRAEMRNIQKLTRKTSYIVKYFEPYSFKDSHTKKVILEWANKNRGTHAYYERLRLLVKAYEIVRKKLNLPTIETIYKNSNFHNQPLQQKIAKEVEDDTFVIDGEVYSIDEIPSLDEDIVRNSPFHRDGMGPRR